MMGEGCGVSASEYSCAHGAQITPYLTCMMKTKYYTVLYLYTEETSTTVIHIQLRILYTVPRHPVPCHDLTAIS
jgi:hypothetical protein